MANVSVVDRIVNSLSFEVEAIPQEDTTKLTSTSNSTPLNVRIRVRKKEECGIEQGFLTVPKFGRPDAIPERVRLISSDQTIMSFDVSMEADFVKKPKRKPRKLFFGGCLGTQYDDDNVPYTRNPTYDAKITDTSTPSKSDGVMRQNFTLSKTKYNNQNDLHQFTKKGILGKCKPGGCLDPPFSEEKYSYEPQSLKEKIPCTMEDSVETNPIIKLTKAIDGHKTSKESKHPSKDNVTQEVEDNSGSVLSIYENSHKGSLDSKYSDSVFTYPPLMMWSAVSNERNSRNKISSEEKPRRSYNDSIEAFYTSPRRSNRFSNSSGTDTGKKDKAKAIIPTPVPVPIPIVNDSDISKSDETNVTKLYVEDTVSLKKAVNDESNKESGTAITSKALLDDTPAKNFFEPNVTAQNIRNPMKFKEKDTNRKAISSTHSPVNDSVSLDNDKGHIIAPFSPTTPLQDISDSPNENIRISYVKRDKAKPDDILSYEPLLINDSDDFHVYDKDHIITAPYARVFQEAPNEISSRYHKGDKEITNYLSNMPILVNDSDDLHDYTPITQDPISTNQMEMKKEEARKSLILPTVNDNATSQFDKLHTEKTSVNDVTSRKETDIDSDSASNNDVIFSDDGKQNVQSKDPSNYDNLIGFPQTKKSDGNVFDDRKGSDTESMNATPISKVAEHTLQSNYDGSMMSDATDATNEKTAYSETHANNKVLDILNESDHQVIQDRNDNLSNQVKDVSETPHESNQIKDISETHGNDEESRQNFGALFRNAKDENNSEITKFENETNSSLNRNISKRGVQTNGNEEKSTQNVRTHFLNAKDANNSEITQFVNETNSSLNRNILKNDVQTNFIPRKRSSASDRPIFKDPTDSDDNIPEECDPANNVSRNEAINEEDSNPLNRLTKTVLATPVPNDTTQIKNSNMFGSTINISDGITDVDFTSAIINDKADDNGNEETENQQDIDKNFDQKEVEQEDGIDTLSMYARKDIRNNANDNQQMDAAKNDTLMKTVAEEDTDRNDRRHNIILENAQLTQNQTPSKTDSIRDANSAISNTSSGIIKQGSFLKDYPTRRAMHISIQEEDFIDMPSNGSQFEDPLKRKHMQNNKPPNEQSEKASTYAASDSQGSVLKLHSRDPNFERTDVKNNTDKDSDTSAGSSKISLKSNSVSLKLGFQSYVNDRNERSLRTIDLSSNNSGCDESVTIIQTHLRPNVNEIRIPIDSDNDMILQIHRTLNPSQHMPSTEPESGGFNHSGPTDLKRYGLPDTPNANNFINNPQDWYEKMNCNDDIPTILNSVYEQEMVPLQNTINHLKKEIETLAGQQSILIEQLVNVKRNKPTRLARVNSRCACFR